MVETEARSTSRGCGSYSSVFASSLKFLFWAQFYRSGACRIKPLREKKTHVKFEISGKHYFTIDFSIFFLGERFMQYAPDDSRGYRSDAPVIDSPISFQIVMQTQPTIQPCSEKFKGLMPSYRGCYCRKGTPKRACLREFWAEYRRLLLMFAGKVLNIKCERT